MTHGTPYPGTSWPAGTSEADKAEFRRMAKGGCELSRSEEELAKAMAMIGPLTKRAAVFDAEPLSKATADEFRRISRIAA